MDVMCGLHILCFPFTQSKIVRCAKDALLSVAVWKPVRGSLLILDNQEGCYNVTSEDYQISKNIN